MFIFIINRRSAIYKGKNPETLVELPDFIGSL
jgi:hypothetical protein